MSNIDKLVQFAELKVGQMGADYREHHPHDKHAEVEPRALRAEGTSIIVSYDERDYIIDLTHSGVPGTVTPEETQEVVEIMRDFYKYA